MVVQTHVDLRQIKCHLLAPKAACRLQRKGSGELYRGPKPCEWSSSSSKRTEEPTTFAADQPAHVNTVNKTCQMKCLHLKLGLERLQLLPQGKPQQAPAQHLLPERAQVPALELLPGWPGRPAQPQALPAHCCWRSQLEGTDS